MEIILMSMHGVLFQRENLFFFPSHYGVMYFCCVRIDWHEADLRYMQLKMHISIKLSD